MIRKILVLPAVLAALVAAAAPAAAQAPQNLTLVVPFENAQNELRFHWLGEAAAVLLADGLRARGVAAIPRPERVAAFEQLHLPLTASLSRATIIKVGQLVGASEVVIGSFSVSGRELTIRAHAIRMDIGRLQPETTERGELTQLFDIFERLVRRLARNASSPAATSARQPPLDAFENYIKGLLAENPATKASFLEAAIREDAGFDRARLALWDVRTEQGEHEEALEVVRPIATGSPLHRGARFSAGISLLELKRYDEAFDAFKRLIEEGSSLPAAANAAVLNNLGVVQIRRGTTPHSGTAVDHLTKAANADPDPDYLFNLGYAYVIDGNHQGALYWLREALRRDPTDPDAHFVLAAALQATGGEVEAARERDIARQLSARYETLDRQGTSEKVPVPSALERVRLELQESRALRADQVIVTSAQREQRELVMFQLDRGRRLFEMEQDREAMAELKRAVYLSPYEAQAHLLIGRIHLRGGRPGDAVEALKISIWSEDTAPARVGLAEAYLKLGKPAAAKTEAERALALDPLSTDAKRLLAEIK